MKYLTSFSVFALSLMLVGAGCTVTQTGGGSAGEPPAGAVDGEWVAGAVKQGGVPGGALAGTINEKAVTIESVIIEDWGDKFRWNFSDVAPSSTCGFTSGASSVKLGSSEFMEGTFMKALDTKVDFNDFSAYYVYPKADGTPNSVNTGWETTVVVTDYQENVGEDNFGKQVGSATGFVQIEFSDGKTEIAGAFTADVCTK